MDNPAPASASNIPNANLMITEQPPTALSPRVSIDQLLLAGAHFGHLTRRWNPKMKRYIFMARNGIYLIDLLKTQAALETACKAIAKISADGEDVLFVGTKKQARDIIEAEARRCEAPYISFRWLGGTLTNFATIRRSLRTLEGYEKMATDGTYDKITKKEQLQIEKNKAKLTRTLEGIRNMRRLPGAVFIVDTKHEEIAVAEARKLNIPVFAIIDTNSDPDLVDYPIPANDDAYKSIWLITNAIADAILEGKRKPGDVEPVEKELLEERPREGRRRSRRRRSRGSGGDRREFRDNRDVRNAPSGSEDESRREHQEGRRDSRPPREGERRDDRPPRPKPEGENRQREGQSARPIREGERRDDRPPRPKPEGENRQREGQSARPAREGERRVDRPPRPKPEGDNRPKGERDHRQRSEAGRRDDRPPRTKPEGNHRPNINAENRPFQARGNSENHPRRESENRGDRLAKSKSERSNQPPKKEPKTE